MKKISHKQIYKKGVFGGITNTTLCGRVNNFESDKNDGMNVDDDFNCKFCLRIASTEYGKRIINESEEIMKEREEKI
jgi:hypothetical protein